MGCGASAYKDACDTLEWAVKRVNLKGDKKYGRFDAYTWQADVIIRCAQEDKGLAETILAIITEGKLIEARREYAIEMEERRILADLQSKY